MSTPLPSIHEQRKLIRTQLDDSSAADAPTAYYALFHPPERSALFVTRDRLGRLAGFAGRMQTGIDLFRPLVTLVCRDAQAADDVLAQALLPGRPYLLFTKLNQLPLVENSLQIDTCRILQIYQLAIAHFKPVINVLVQTEQAGDGTPRCQIKSGDKVLAVAGLNWQSPAFAEIYVHTEPAARQRGWGTSVASAVTEMVLAGGRIPIYLVDTNHTASRQLAESLGYFDTGARQVYADVVYQGHPGQAAP